MPFDKVETQVDFPALERAILEFWQRHDTFELLRAKNTGGPRWSFLSCRARQKACLSSPAQ